jgi:hypothetical protein
MSQQPHHNARRYVRATGPFHGYHLGLRKAPVLVFNLNVGGGFVHFSDERPTGKTFALTIDLDTDGRITVLADTVYRDASGIAVRFVDVEPDESERLARAVDRMRAQQATTPGQ